jgi:DNA-binding MarR family transcriptional regulator
MEQINKHIEERVRNIVLSQNDPITQHGFTQVPNFLFKKSGLSMGAIVVYSKFLSYTWHNDFCFPGQQRLADELDMSIGSINTFIKELESANLIEITRRGQGRTNIYKINFVVQRRPKGLKS